MTDTDDKPQAETETAPEPKPETAATYVKLFKLALPFLLALVPGGAAVQQAMAAQDKGAEAWSLTAPTVNALIDRVEAGDAERLALTKEVAKLTGILSAKGLIPTSRAEVASSAKPVRLEGEVKPDKAPKKGKGEPPKNGPPKVPGKKPVKPKKPPIKKLPVVLVA
jgi:hypothetical protein